MVYLQQFASCIVEIPTCYEMKRLLVNNRLQIETLQWLLVPITETVGKIKSNEIMESTMDDKLVVFCCYEDHHKVNN